MDTEKAQPYMGFQGTREFLILISSEEKKMGVADNDSQPEGEPTYGEPALPW